LFEPILPNQPDHPLQLLRKAVAVRQPSVLVTLFSLTNKRDKQTGTCLLLEANGNISGCIPYEDLDPLIMEDAKEAMRLRRSSFRQYQGNESEITAFIEFLQPAPSLVVVGAGNDAIPMMQMADTIGWDVRVVDGRGSHAKPERFVGACQVLVSKPEKVLEQIPVDEQTVFVMMTHNYNYDLAMLRALLPLPISYIGMLGPRKKLDRMLDELRAEGMMITDEMLKKVYGPTGLEIGAETAAEIALSILAEIKSVLTRTPGGPLRDKKDVIHSRSDTQIKERNVDMPS
jgi:xanthine/CO dehydrogenase XdhC/CoxF family maturation factor